MSKTLVVPRHEPGPAQNGHDGCHARFGNGGMCPGVGYAEWLNGLGDDAAFYIKPTQRCSEGTTNGQVRQNWLSNAHIVALQPALAALKAEERRTAASLRMVRREIKRVEAALEMKVSEVLPK